MKKLMVLLAAVALAGAAQAEYMAWASGIYSAGTTTAYNGTAYLYVLGPASVDGLASSWFNDKKADTGSSFASVTVNNGEVSNQHGDDNISGLVILAIYDSASGNMFVATTMATSTPAMVYSEIGFNGLTSASQAAATEWTDGMSSTGWYKAAGSAVPEPTSGLLLLVGGALLALRRKRA